MPNYGQDIVDRGTERLKGTWDYQGEEYNLIVEDISYADKRLLQKYISVTAPVIQAQEAGDEIDEADAEEIEARLNDLGSYSWMDSEIESDPVIPVVREKLIRPDTEPDNLPDEKLNPLVQGMMETWEESDEIEKAREEMPLEGNG